MKANRTTLIYRYGLYTTASCHSGIIPKFKIKYVEHGKIVGAKGSYKISKGHCKGRPIKGLVLKYTPKPGFRGLAKAKVILSVSIYDDDSEYVSETLNFNIRVK